ncbi:hypothetical protein FACS1894155_12220 [Bacteroidia bacterium]|nr:hypothetical protein FACS189455_3730 [Bacteroidia bacterium]GHU92059.1 hypothetical protein FACS1894155_12220 [Bacteroidia bacterium]
MAQCNPPKFFPINKYQVKDTAFLKITYKLDFVKDPKRIDDRCTDIQLLQIGKNSSKYFSLQAVEYNTEIQELIKKGTSGTIPFNTQNGTNGYEIFKNIQKNEIKVTDLGTCLSGNFLYSDNFPSFSWEIKPDTSTLLSYPCQKAITSFRGRTYEAWFTMAIPISNGPWKFGGLPGIILKISDTNNEYLFECIRIENTHEPIKFYDLEYKSTSRQDLNKLYKRYHDDPVIFRLNQGIITLKMSDTGESKELKSSQKIPYNTIELE